MEKQVLNRVFVYGDKKLSDPNPKMSPEQVVNFYSTQFSELTTATIDNGVVHMKRKAITYTIGKTLGTKG
jgi:PRTRC genetic system protein C